MLLKSWVFLENMERYWKKKKKEFHQELQWTRYYNQKQNLSFIVGNQKQKPILFYFFLIWEKKYVYTEKKNLWHKIS